MKKVVKQIILFYFIIALSKILLSLLIPAPSAYSDEYVYMKLARSFFFDFDFSIHNIVVDIFPPLYSMLLSVSYIFKDMTIVYLFMKVINALISSLIIIPAFLLSKEFLSEKKSLIIALLISILPSSFSFTPYIMSENLFYPLFLFTIYFIYKSFSEKKYDYSILAGAFLGLSYLARTIAVGLIGVFFLSYLILFLLEKTDRKLLFKKFIILLFLFFIVISPWMIKNFYLYGFHLKLFLGPYTPSALNLVTNFKLINYLVKYFVYISYIILASLIIFPLKSINFINKKNIKFSILLIASLIITLAIAANHGTTEFFFKWFTGKFLGRYVDFLLPLVFIAGFAGVNKIKKINKSTVFIFTFFLIIGSLLTLHALFPVNNLSLTWIGVLKYLFELIFYKKVSYSIDLFTGSLIFFSVFFVFLLFLILFLEKKFSLNKLIPYFFIFLILLNLLNYGVIYYDSKTNWYDEEQMQLGLWLNEYDSDKISNVLFDEKSCGELDKDKREAICGGVNNSRTIIGYWLNDNIVVGDLSNLQNYDYVISQNKLNLLLIKESDNGIYIYKLEK